MPRLNPLRLVAIVAGAFVSIYLAVAVGGFLLAGNGCENEVLAEVVAPDASARAVVFQRSCGATTGFSTQVSILPAGAELSSEPGNAFVSDTNHGASPSGPGGGPELALAWRSPNELVIAHHPATRVLNHVPVVNGVKVHAQSGLPHRDG
jgi:hypothetical protein